jgi:phosphoserine phosphatase
VSVTERAPAAAPRPDALVESIAREPSVLVLIGDPAKSDLTDRVAFSVAAALPHRLGRLHWLSHGIACEYPITDWSEEAGDIAAAVRQGLEGYAIDVAVVPVQGRRKRLLVADMDSTIIAEECIDELAGPAGIRATIEAITRRAMRGEIDFETALRDRVDKLKGLDASAIDRILEERITLNPGAKELVATMRAHGAHTALVSGGFTQFVARVAERAGFQSHQANSLEIAEGRLTGRLVPPVLGRQAKANELRRLATHHRLNLSETLAVGDGANDIEMVREAGLGVAYRAKQQLEQAADVVIRNGDLTALLYLQGYTRNDLRCTD